MHVEKAQVEYIIVRCINRQNLFYELGTVYSHWYNWKYDRCGHVFQDRFISENVEDEKYLISVVRYVHQNPIAANMVGYMEEYGWSSDFSVIGGDKWI